MKQPLGVSYPGATYKFTVLDTLGRRVAQQGAYLDYILLTWLTLQYRNSLNQAIKPLEPLTPTLAWAEQTTTSNVYSLALPLPTTITRS